MKARRMAIVAVVLLDLFTISLEAQGMQHAARPGAQTRQQLLRTLQDFREAKDLHGEATTLLQLGIAELSLGDIDGGRNHLVDAAKKLRAQNDPVGEWLTLLMLSQTEIALGRPDEAIPHIKKAFTVLNEAKASTAPFTLKTFMALGAQSGLPVQLPPIPEGGPDAGILKTMMIEYLFIPLTHDIYGSVLTQVGQLDRAEEELKAAGAGSVNAGGALDFTIELHFGDLRFRQKRYDEGRVHYTKALSASSRSMVLLSTSGEPLLVLLYGRLAQLEAAAGNPEEAKRWLKKIRDSEKERVGTQ